MKEAIFYLVLFFGVISNAYRLSHVQRALNADKRSADLLTLKAAGNVPYVPYQPSPAGPHMWLDIYNVLGRKRKLFVSRFLDDEACNVLVSSLLWLDNQNDEKITLYLNVPGGSMQPALAIYDTMSRLRSPIEVINTGLTVGVGCLLAAAGTPGLRYAFPNSRFLMGKAGLDEGISGQSVEIALQVARIMQGNKKVMEALAFHTNQGYEKVEQDLKRDFYLTAPEAVLYGLVDTVMKPDQPVKMMKARKKVENLRIGFGHFAESEAVGGEPRDQEMPEDRLFELKAAEEMANLVSSVTSHLINFLLSYIIFIIEAIEV